MSNGPARMAPHNIEAEEAVLGSILIDPDAIFKVVSHLNAEDFYREKNGWLYAAVRDLKRRSEPADFVTLCDELERRGQLEEVGGAAHIIFLINAVPTAIHAEYYARIVERTAILRRLISAAGRIAGVAYESDVNVEEAVDRAQELLREVIKRKSSATSAILRPGDSQEFVYQTVETLRQRAEAGNLVAWDTPWPDVNRMLGSFRAGHLFTLAGYPGHGKTALFAQIAEHNAQKGANIAFFHAEHQHSWIMFRRIMRLTGAHFHKLERGQCMAEALEAEETVNTWPGGIHYIHCPGWSAEQIARTMADLNAAGGCDLAVVDYLQKLRLSSKGWNKADLLGNAVEIIKTAGERLRIPVLLGSQLNRAGHHAGRPGLEHLRGSGEIEEKSNYCAFVFRDKIGERELSTTAELYQEKPYSPGAELFFNPDRLAFYSATREELS